MSLPECIRRHGRGYRAVVSDCGLRKYGPTFDTVAEAERWRDDYRAALRGDGAPLTFAGARQQLDTELRLVAARPATFEFYDDLHRNLLTHWKDTDVLGAVTGASIRDFIAARLLAVSPQTVRFKDLPLLRRYLRFAQKLGQLPRDPFVDVRLPKARRQRFDSMPAADIAAVLHKIRSAGNSAGQKERAARDADLIEFLFLTGLRRSELCRLRRGDFDTRNGRLFVEGKTENAYLPLTVELQPLAARMLARCLPDGRLVRGIAFLDEVFRRWRKFDRRLKAHVMRHSFATALARGGASPYVLRDLLRHSTLTQSARYLHAQSDHAVHAIDQLARQLRQPPPDRP